MPTKHTSSGSAASLGGGITVEKNPDAPAAFAVEELGARLRILVDIDGSISVTATALAKYPGADGDRTVAVSDTAPITLDDDLIKGLRAAQAHALDSARGKLMDAAYEARAVARRMGEIE